MNRYNAYLSNACLPVALSLQMQKAGSVDDVEKIRTTLLAMTYEGMWKISFDDHSEQVFDFDIVHLKKGGAKEVVHVEP